MYSKVLDNTKEYDKTKIDSLYSNCFTHTSLTTISSSSTNLIFDLSNFYTSEFMQMREIVWATMGNGGKIQIGKFITTRCTGTYNVLSVKALDGRAYSISNNTITVNTGDSVYQYKAYYSNIIK